MTTQRGLKRIIRDRQAKTGESYTAARAQVMRDRTELLGLGASEAASAAPTRVEASVLKVNQRSVRVRVLGEDGQVTFRSTDAWDVVPGHVATLVVERRWTWRGDAYASGRIEDPHIDVQELRLDPLPLHGGEPDDLRSVYEPYRRPDPYAPLWRKLTAQPRACFEMDPIAWGAFPGARAGADPVSEAAERAEAGDPEGARERLMDLLCADLRCIDAHAHLGNLEFERDPQRAIVHYEIGARIGELSLPPGFDGALLWGQLYNRPFLRSLKGRGLCLWRLGRQAEAQGVFERILSLNPNDNQGVRFCWNDVRRGRAWEDMQDGERKARRQPLPTVH
jgi:hypothetical protein